MIMDNLFNETQDSKYQVCPLIRKLVRAGRLPENKQGFTTTTSKTG